MNLIEQLEKLPRFSIFKLGISAAMVEQQNGKYVNIEDIRAIIEQAKREAVEPVAVPDHTKLIGELVEALERCEDANSLYEARLVAGKTLTKAREAIK